MAVVTLSIAFFMIILPNYSNTFRWIRREYYCFIKNTIESNAGSEAAYLAPLMFTIFSMILFGNIIGMIPGVYPSTCDIYLNLIMSCSVVFGTLILAIYNQGTGAVNLFCPSGVPFPINIALFCIELPLFFLRIFTLAGRLLLNISAGHLVVACILDVASQMPWLSFMYIFVMFIELMTAGIQAYIFLILSSIYLEGAFHRH